MNKEGLYKNCEDYRKHLEEQAAADGLPGLAGRFWKVERHVSSENVTRRNEIKIEDV